MFEKIRLRSELTCNRFVMCRVQPAIDRASLGGEPARAKVRFRMDLVTFGEAMGILLIGAGLALLSLIGWMASRRGAIK